MVDTTALEPEAIFSAVSAQPPLRRDEARASYVGREVDWTLVYIDGWEQSRGRARLAFKQERSIARCVFASVPLTDCPWLKHLHAGEIMRVRGRIAELNQLTITLRGASVSQVIAEVAEVVY